MVDLDQAPCRTPCEPCRSPGTASGSTRCPRPGSTTPTPTSGCRETSLGSPRRRRRQVDEVGEPGTVEPGCAEGYLVGLGALEVEVSRVLPRHPDTAVQLDGLLRGPHRDVPAERR